MKLGFTKLDEKILQSSIMAESSNTFKIWISLLAACKENGVAYVSPIYLSTICHIPLGRVDDSLERLMAPDKHSRSIADDGRRIRRVDGGFEIINYAVYRTISLRGAEAERKRLYRQREKGCPDGVPECPDASASASASSSASELDKNLIPIDQKLVQLLIDLMQKNNPNSVIIKRLMKNGQDAWLRSCRLLREADKRTPEEIEAVVRFSQSDEFWRSNILSMPKLREKWDQLWMKMNRGKNKTQDRMSGIKEWLKDKESGK